MLADEIRENRVKLKQLNDEFNNADPEWVEPILYAIMSVESAYSNLMKEYKKKIIKNNI
jgi:hypothetical protein